MDNEGKIKEPHVDQTEQITKDEEEKEITCGLVMPISAMDSYSAQHWQEVKQIIIESLAGDFYNVSLVSDANDVGVIHNRIVKNLYYTDIVVCDVSGKNPNVMFELGLRLAFDKPTIIIKDDKTNYSFDTAPIEHLQYPADLRYSNIVDFKKLLKEKVKATYENSLNPDSKTFLDHFGEFKIAELKDNKVTSNEFILASLSSIADDLSKLTRKIDRSIHIQGYSSTFDKLYTNTRTPFVLKEGIVESGQVKDPSVEEILDSIRNIISHKPE